MVRKSSESSRMYKRGVLPKTQEEADEISSDTALIISESQDIDELKVHGPDPIFKSSNSIVFKGKLENRDVVVKVPKYDEFNFVEDDEDALEEAWQKDRLFFNEHIFSSALSGDDEANRRIVSYRGIFTHDDIANYFSDDQFPYAEVSDYVRGKSLSDIVYKRRLGRVPFRKIFTYAKGMSEGLDMISSSGVVFGDMKLENVVIDHRDEPVIIDFGCSKIMGQDGKFISEGVIDGSPQYIHTDIWNSYEYSEKTDTYALLVCAYEMFFNTVPYNLEDAYYMMDRTDIDISYDERIDLLRSKAVEILSEKPVMIYNSKRFRDIKFFDAVKEFFDHGFTAGYDNVADFSNALEELEKDYDRSRR